MERIFRSVLIVSAGIAASLAIAGGLVQASIAPDDNDRLAAESKTVATPLYFEQNQGQTDPSVRYVQRSSGMTAFLRDTDVVLRLPVASEDGRASTVTRMRFAGAQETVIVTGNDPLAGHSNYFKGSDPDGWITDVTHFATVKYEEIYPGIDVMFLGHEGQMRYDFHVAPGADPSQIRLAFSGVEDLSVSESGDLVLKSAIGHHIHRAPMIYQDYEGVRTMLAGEFQILDDHIVGFRLDDYDESLPLVIDPIISYSTYLGGGAFDSGRAIRVDPSDDSIVVTGRTNSVDFPLASAVQSSIDAGPNPFGWAPNPNATDGVFLWDKTFGRSDSTSLKITASTRSVFLSNPGWRTTGPIPLDMSKTYETSVWANSPDGGVGHIPAVQFFDAFDTFLGTIGATGDSNFPAQPLNTWVQRTFMFTPTAFPAFATATHVRLIVVQDIQISVANSPPPTLTTVFFDDVVLAEMGGGLNLAPNASFSGSDFFDVFVSKLTADGSSLVFSTYLGGNANEIPQNLELDSTGNILVGGRTSSPDFPTTAGTDQTYGGPFEDGFLTKMVPNGSSLVFSTYVGGNDTFHPLEEVRGIITDSSDNIWVVGNTGSLDFFATHVIFAGLPCAGAMLPFTTGDIFVRKYSTSGAVLLSVCFGGTGRDAGRNIAFDSSANIVLTGWTQSTDFPTTAGVVQPLFGGGGIDGWVAKLNPGATSITWASYLGGSDFEFLEGVVVDSADNVSVSGQTFSADYPVANAVQSTIGNVTGTGLGDGVVSKLNPTGTAFVFSTFFGGDGDDFAWGLKGDQDDRLLFTGFTGSTDFPTTAAAFQPTLGGPQDSFISQLSPDGQTIEFSSYLGGSRFEASSNGLYVIRPGKMWLTGTTDSDDFVTVDPFQATKAGAPNSSSNDAFITGLFTPIEVPADDCADPGGCDLGGQILEFPPGTDTAGATVTRMSTEEPEPGDNGVDTIALAGDRLLIPPQFRSSSPIQILEMDSGVEFTDGTILVTIEPGDFLDDPLPCDEPIPPGVDPQLQDIVVWQTTDVSEIAEGRAIEVTADCGGSSRGRIRGLSFFVVGLHIDCGIDWFVDPHGVKQCFVDLNKEKFQGLLEAVLRSEDVLSDEDHEELVDLAVSGNRAFLRRSYDRAEDKLTQLIDELEEIDFEASNFNHSGNIEMRAYNVRFMITKIQNIITNIKLMGDDDSDSDSDSDSD